MTDGKKPMGRGLSALISNRPASHNDEDTPISLYRKALFNAYREGSLSDEGAKMLAHNRQQLGITIQQHENLKASVLAKIQARREEEEGGQKLKVIKKKKIARPLDAPPAPQSRPQTPSQKPLNTERQWEKEQDSIKSDLKDIFFRETAKPAQKTGPQWKEDAGPEVALAKEGPDGPTDGPADEEEEFMVQEDEEVEFVPEDEPMDQPAKAGKVPEEEEDTPLDRSEASDRNEVLSLVIDHIKQGTKYFANKEYQKALEQYQKVIDIDPDNEKVLKAIAMVKERLSEECDELEAPTQNVPPPPAPRTTQDDDVAFDDETQTKDGPKDEDGPKQVAPEVMQHNEQIKGSWQSEQDRIRSELAGLLTKAKTDPGLAPPNPLAAAGPPEKPFTETPSKPLPTLPPSTSAKTSQPLSIPQAVSGTAPKKIEIDFIRDATPRPPAKLPEFEPEEPEEIDIDTRSQVPEELEEIVPEPQPAPERGTVRKSPEEIQKELEGARIKDGHLKEEAQKAKAELYTKAIAKGQEGNFNEALFLINKLLEVEPEHKDAWNDKGVILWNLGKAELAVDCYHKARELNPESLEPLINLGVAYKSLGQSDKALECYEEALKKDPAIEEVWINKGVLLFQLGKTEEADVAFMAAIKVNPNTEEGWGYRAYCLEQMNRFEEASTCYDYVLNINPHNEDAKRGKEICAKKIRQTLMKDWLN